MAAGCLWLLSVILLLPAVWIGIAYKYNLSEWLSLLPLPDESEEFFPWVIRIVLVLSFIGSTAALAVLAFQSRKSGNTG